jgi:hypothetical protein
MIRITITLDSAASHALAVLVERARRGRGQRRAPSVSEVIRLALCELVRSECITEDPKHASQDLGPQAE